MDDLPALKYTIMLNGVTQLALTKVDVLNTFASVKACVAYKHKGQTTDRVPFDLVGADIEPCIRHFRAGSVSWMEGGRSGLPQTLQDYLQFLETAVGVPVTMLSAGPERDKLMEF